MKIYQNSQKIKQREDLIASIIIFIWSTVKANKYLLAQNYFDIAILGIFMIIIEVIIINFLHDLAKQFKKGVK